MPKAYTLEDFRRDLIRFMQHNERNDESWLADLSRILSVVEAIPPTERESSFPFLTPSLREQIAQASNVSTEVLEEILGEYRRLAVVVAALEKRRR